MKENAIKGKPFVDTINYRSRASGCVLLNLNKGLVIFDHFL